MTSATLPAPTFIHRSGCRSMVYRDNDYCDCRPLLSHRAYGTVGSFTVHAPADYQPRHAAPLI